MEKLNIGKCLFKKICFTTFLNVDIDDIALIYKGSKSINLEPLQRMLCPHKIWDGFKAPQVLGPLIMLMTG